MSLDSIRRTLSSAPGVSDWIALRQTTSEAQRYLIFDRPESSRTVDRSITDVTVFHDHDGGRGSAEVRLSGRNADLGSSAVEEAVFAAGLQSNPPFSLPVPAPFEEVTTADPELSASRIRSAMDGIQERILAAVAEETGIRLSSAEVFVERSTREILTSTGVQGAYEETALFVDLVLLSRDGNEEAESHAAKRVRRLADLDIEGMVRRQARFARDSTRTGSIRGGTRAVVLTHGSFLPLFGPFGFAVSGEGIHGRQSTMEVGAPLFGEREVRGDRLTLSSDPTVPFGIGSAPFDGQGLALRPVTAIENGVVRSIVADKQYAEYLGVPPTGDWTNGVVAPGKATRDELLKPVGAEPVLEIVEFSWLNPEHVRGRFSTEIRLAYEHGPEGPRPVKGGAFAGSVYDLFTEVRTTGDQVLDGRYVTPSALRFERATVAGS